MGKRNYRYFFGFVVMVLILVCWVFVWSLYLLIAQSVGSNFIAAVAANLIALLELVLCFLFAWCLCGLAGFHCYLISVNLTTNEQIKAERAERAALRVRSERGAAAAAAAGSNEQGPATPAAESGGGVSVSMPYAPSGRRGPAPGSCGACFAHTYALWANPIPDSLITLLPDDAPHPSASAASGSVAPSAVPLTSPTPSSAAVAATSLHSITVEQKRSEPVAHSNYRPPLHATDVTGLPPPHTD